MIHHEGEQASVPHDTEWWWAEAQSPEPRPHADLARHTTELRRLVAETAWLMEVLHVSRAVIARLTPAHRATSWCVAAGAVRSVVWNQLHGFEIAEPAEVDLVHFSPELAPSVDVDVARELVTRLPRFRWDVVNQVYAHRLARDPSATPFVCLEHALACWPETATAVGVFLTHSGSLEVIAPHGLADLFGLILRRSPLLRDPDVFEQRALAKRFRERWPRLISESRCAVIAGRPRALGPCP